MSQDIVSSYTSFESVLISVLALIVIAIFWWALYSFFQAIFLFIFSKWEEDKYKSAWNTIRFLVRWLIMTVILLLFFPVLMRYAGVKSYEVYEAKNIFKRVGEILQSAMDLWKDVTSSQRWNINWWFEANPDAIRDYSL